MSVRLFLRCDAVGFVTTVELRVDVVISVFMKNVAILGLRK